MATAIEYGLIASLISVGIIGTVTALGANNSDAYASQQRPDAERVTVYEQKLEQDGLSALYEQAGDLALQYRCELAAGMQLTAIETEANYFAAASVYNANRQVGRIDLPLGLPYSPSTRNPAYLQTFTHMCVSHDVIPDQGK